MDFGKLTVITGPVQSRKTEALIMLVSMHKAEDTTVVALKPYADTRYPGDRIQTQYGFSIPATKVADAAAAMHELDRLSCSIEDPVLAMDEVNLFYAAMDNPSMFRRFLAKARQRCKEVIFTGLNRDFRGEAFDPMPMLLALADEIHTMTAPCAICGSPAGYTQRIGDSKKLIEVGGTESYRPLCLNCFSHPW